MPPPDVLTEEQKDLIRAALLDAEDKARLERCACRDEIRAQYLAGVLDGITDVRRALGVANDPMPPDAIERTVNNVRDAYMRFLEASEARKAADAERGIR